MSTHVNGTPGVGLSFATRLAMLEMESEHAQYRAECTLRDAAREGKREANQKQVQELREKASSILTQAFTSGALQIAAGGAQIASASAQLDAGYAHLEAAEVEHSLGQLTPDSSAYEALWQRQQSLRQGALDVGSISKKLCAASGILEKSAKIVDIAFGAVSSNHEAKAAQSGHRADDAKSRVDDANDAARRHLSQLDQKLGILQQILDSEAETHRALLRG